VEVAGLSGHSKWASIKHKKAATDAKKGQMFTKLARDITMAAKQGDPDPELNAGLRLAIQKAKQANMPADNIDRAVKRAAGLGDAANLEEITYEGYGPAGSAVIVHVVTDNRNRTVAEVRFAFSRAGGSMADNGAVSWQFDNRGVILLNAAGRDLDEVQRAGRGRDGRGVGGGDHRGGGPAPRPRGAGGPGARGGERRPGADPAKPHRRF
jgi:YebC/PmpR family DNA-binding regulatory protein